MLRDKIADLITNEIFERFGSPSSAVIGVQLSDRIVALIRDPGGLDDCPRYAAGEYSRRNLEAFADDIGVSAR